MSNIRKVSFACCAFVLLLLTASAAKADTVIFYSSRAAFDTAVSSQTTIPFSAPPNGVTSHGSSLTVSGVTFQSQFGSIFQVDPGYASGYYTLGNSAGLLSTMAYDPTNGANFQTVITLPAGTTAVGMDLGVSVNVSVPMTVTLSNGTTQTLLLTGSVYNPGTGGYESVPTFFGFTSDVEITSIFISLPYGIRREYLKIDDFSFGTASSQPPTTPTPEPATMLLLGTGLASVAIRARRRRNL